MKITLPALAVAVAPAGFGEPMAVAPLVIAIVAIDLLLHTTELH